jgi:hypothetical protein
LTDPFAYFAGHLTVSRFVNSKEGTVMLQQKIRQWAPTCEFSPPASHDSIFSAEHALGVKLPPELGSLLLESNGVTDKYGSGLIWPIECIRAENTAFRSNSDFRDLYMPFDPLLFFADAGNGDQFAYIVLAGRVRRSDIFCWDHENDSRTWVAPSLEKYLDWWLSGKLKL